MKYGFKEIRTEMGMFEFTVVTIVGPFKNTGKYIAWKFDDKNYSDAHFERGYDPRGRCYFNAGNVPVIWIPRKPKTARDHATLAHECLHAVYCLFDWADLPLTKDNEEVMTHAMAHLINDILSKL